MVRTRERVRIPDDSEFNLGTYHERCQDFGLALAGLGEEHSPLTPTAVAYLATLIKYSLDPQFRWRANAVIDRLKKSGIIAENDWQKAKEQLGQT